MTGLRDKLEGAMVNRNTYPSHPDASGVVCFWMPKDTREGWPPGAWDREPDMVAFQAHGLPCALVRFSLGGNWCGYASIPDGHPWHGGGMCDAYGVAGLGDCSYAAHHWALNSWAWGFDYGHLGHFQPGKGGIFGGDPRAIYVGVNEAMANAVAYAKAIAGTAAAKESE